MVVWVAPDAFSSHAGSDSSSTWMCFHNDRNKIGLSLLPYAWKCAYATHSYLCRIFHKCGIYSIEMKFTKKMYLKQFRIWSSIFILIDVWVQVELKMVADLFHRFEFRVAACNVTIDISMFLEVMQLGMLKWCERECGRALVAIHVEKVSNIDFVCWNLWLFDITIGLFDYFSTRNGKGAFKKLFLNEFNSEDFHLLMPWWIFVWLM